MTVDQHRGDEAAAIPAADGEPFGPELVVVADRLRVIVEALNRPNRIDATYGETLSDPEPQVVVHREVELLVEGADGFECLPGEEDRGRIDTASEIQLGPEIERGPRPYTSRIDSVAVYAYDIRVSEAGLAKGGDPGRDCFGLVGVVGVQPAEDVATSHREALVERVRLATIRLRDPVQVFVLGKDLERSVRRSAVNDDVLDRRIRLRHDALDRFSKVPGLIEGGGDDRDERHTARGMRTGSSSTSRPRSSSYTRSTARALLAGSKRTRACSAAASPSRRRRSGSLMSRRSAAASCSGLASWSSRPVLPGSSTPAPASEPDATTGLPYVAASSTGRPRPTPWFGNVTMSSAL